MLVIINWYFIMVILCISLMDFHIYWSFVCPQNEVKLLSRVRLFATLWTVAYQAPPSLGFSRQESGVGCHFLLLGIFPTQALNPGLPYCRQMLYPLSQQGRPKEVFNAETHLQK